MRRALVLTAVALAGWRPRAARRSAVAGAHHRPARSSSRGREPGTMTRRRCLRAGPRPTHRVPQLTGGDPPYMRRPITGGRRSVRVRRSDAGDLARRPISAIRARSARPGSSCRAPPRPGGSGTSCCAGGDKRDAYRASAASREVGGRMAVTGSVRAATARGIQGRRFARQSTTGAADRKGRQRASSVCGSTPRQGSCRRRRPGTVSRSASRPRSQSRAVRLGPAEARALSPTAARGLRGRFSDAAQPARSRRHRPPARGGDRARTPRDHRGRPLALRASPLAPAY